ncbi:MAG TPA: DUF3857 domain-containing protein [Bryobacteraceae bacterium]|nr:DUF3857 domain-containing protein [Bryobacteraceae bacterium]
MNATFRGRLLPLLLLATSGAFAQENVNAGINIAWDPVTDAERQSRAPVVDKEAGVEALFWTVHVQDELRGSDLQRVLYHYIRLKVFDEKGKEKAATIDIEFDSKTAILAIAARTIKADGSIVEMTRDAVHQRDLVRAGGRKVVVKSFAIPGIEPGAIVEYRYKEVRDNPRVLYTRLQLQREYPVQRVTYYVKPLSRDYTEYNLGMWPFNCTPSPLKTERNGFQSFSLENVPAFREEPFMPAEPNVRPWVLLVYRKNEQRDPERYWTDVGRKSYDRLKQSLKVTDEIKQAAAEAAAGAKTEEERVSALLRYLWKHTRGFYDAGVTEPERSSVLARMPKDRMRTAAEVLKSGLGSADERNLLFAAMATSIGLEARPALLPNRQDILFDPRMADEYFLDNVDMAVKIHGNWKLYDVSANHLPPGMLSWTEEAVPALLGDPKKPAFIESPISAPEDSATRRTAQLTLSDDGGLEGDIDESLSGHAAAARRSDLDGESEARQQEIVKEEIIKTFPQADVSGIVLKCIEDPIEPVQLHYHIKVPGYATRTAKRILLQPLFFQRGSTPLFTAADRRYPIAFRYPWKESDEVVVKLPPGWVPDGVLVPRRLDFGKNGYYSLTPAAPNRTELVMKRELVFGDGGSVSFDVKAYPQLKVIFDTIYGRDGYAIALRQSEGGQ